ncbi:MAG: LysE family transporter [Burkholderiaceae bacterium]|jgi:homoserine/homoserine lactone efflux protein|nr:LysE family transporter [Burkholderiaceae bacterium]
MTLATWLTFLVAAFAISLSPGAAAVAAMNAGLNHGFKRGYIMIFGFMLGIMTQLTLVAIGLGALVATSGTAFLVVKWVGVAYLAWLGIQQWRSPKESWGLPGKTKSLAPASQLVFRGWAINALNPKGTIFILAIVPQFLNINEPLWHQYIIIGATLGSAEFIVMLGYTALAAQILSTLKTGSHLRVMNRIFGTLFIAAAASLAVFNRSN